jgi:hypothetical protein
MAIDYTEINNQLDLEFPTCEHSDPEARLTKYRGAWRVCFQCGNCGKKLDMLPKGELDQDDLLHMPLFDSDLPKLYRQRRQARRRELVAEAKAAERYEWHRAYEKYLASPEWKARRERVYRRERLYQGRDDVLCTNCLERPAEVVHHLHYRRAFRELTSDLTVFCHRCHSEEAHGFPLWPE